MKSLFVYLQWQSQIKMYFKHVSRLASWSRYAVFKLSKNIE